VAAGIANTVQNRLDQIPVDCNSHMDCDIRCRMGSANTHRSIMKKTKHSEKFSFLDLSFIGEGMILPKR
jgi:hypothetical protein